VQTGDTTTATRIIMVNNPYRDTLLLSDFQFEIPAEATAILGIGTSIVRLADSVGAVADYEVRMVSEGEAVGLDRAQSTTWDTTFVAASYGGDADLWGAEWTAEKVNASGFGIALTPMYLSSGGNSRAYVDFVEITIHYEAPCD
jgi:hypothetical protein